MPQAIQIEIQSEQQGLTLLCSQRAARRTGRELALHRTERSEIDAGRGVVETLAAFRRALHECARFSFRAWASPRRGRRNELGAGSGQHVLCATDAMLWSSRRRKRCKVVKSGTLANPSA